MKTFSYSFPILKTFDYTLKCLLFDFRLYKIFKQAIIKVQTDVQSWSNENFKPISENPYQIEYRIL